jgi:hypothetical protein
MARLHDEILYTCQETQNDLHVITQKTSKVGWKETYGDKYLDTGVDGWEKTATTISGEA